MKVLVVGGLGFIGHHVVQRLEHLGHEVVITDIKTDYGIVPQEEHSKILQYRLSKIKAPVYTIDVCDSAGIDWLYNKIKPELVIHLAALPRQRLVADDPYLGSQVIVGGMLNLIQAHKKHTPEGRFVYVSTSMIYGNTRGWVHETDPVFPTGAYAILKHTGEKLLEDSSVPYTIIRPAAVYGEGDIENRVISKFLMSAIRGETLDVHGKDTVLSFTHVEDCANGIILAATSQMAENNIYNIAYEGEPYSLLTAAKIAIACASNGSIKILDPELGYPKTKRLAIARASFDLRFEPVIDLKTGLYRYYDWLTEQAE